MANIVVAQNQAQKDTSFYLNQDKYLLEYIEKDNSLNPEKTIIAKLYRAGKYLLSHTIYDGFEDSHYKETERGTIVISPLDNTIVFYTYWSFEGEDNATTWGVRKQSYQAYVQQLFPVGNKIYIEEGLPTDGKIFLHQNPVNKEEKRLFRNYIRIIQKKYKATFLFGKDADQLILETKQKIASK